MIDKPLNGVLSDSEIHAITYAPCSEPNHLSESEIHTIVPIEVFAHTLLCVGRPLFEFRVVETLSACYSMKKVENIH